MKSETLTIESIHHALMEESYFAERGLETTIFLSLQLKKPLFLEGEAGVGKTEVAKVLSRILKTELIRLQCYEGLDSSSALYEWNYASQLLYLRLLEAGGGTREEMRKGIFSRDFLQQRPLLRAIEAGARGS
ncbi:MAG: AAA family ATPase, partial [Acidobacteriota bacterium]